MVTMSKQVNEIVNFIIKNKSFDINLEDIIKKYTNNNILEIINQVIKEVSKKGYIIESINPLIIKEV